MEKVIEQLRRNKESELIQIGLTPRATFKGTQEAHDLQHKQMAEDYQKAIDMLSGGITKQIEDSVLNLYGVVPRFCIRDFTCGELHEFCNYPNAKKEYDKIYAKNIDEECDMQLYKIIDEVDNVSNKM